MRELILDSSALKHNLERVRFFAPTSKILAMVKSNAYGHGLIFVSKILENAGADALGVAAIEEAVTLREAGISIPIVLMSGCFDRLALEEAQRLAMEVILLPQQRCVLAWWPLVMATVIPGAPIRLKCWCAVSALLC